MADHNDKSRRLIELAIYSIAFLICIAFIVAGISLPIVRLVVGLIAVLLFLKILALLFTFEAVEKRTKHIFLLPTVIIILLLSIFPLITSLGFTFTDLHFSRIGGEIHFPVFVNYARFFKDSRIWITAMNTLIFVAVGVLFQYVLGLGLALLLNENFIGRSFFRLIFIMPMMLTPVTVAYVARMIFSEDKGPLNHFLRVNFGLIPPWFSHRWMARVTIASIDAWQWTPFMIIVLLAGLQALPQEIYEAARVDGASAWQSFWSITFPLLAPVSVTAILIRSLEIFKVIDIIHVTTGGGPGQVTESVTMYAHTVGLKEGDLAYASTIAYLLLAMVIVTSTVFLNFLRKQTLETA